MDITPTPDGLHTDSRRAQGRRHSARTIDQAGSGYAQHPAQRGSVEVRVGGSDREPTGRESRGQVGRNGALAHPPLAACDGHDGPNRGQTFRESALLIHDLLEEVGAGFVGDVLVGSNFSHRVSPSRSELLSLFVECGKRVDGARSAGLDQFFPSYLTRLTHEDRYLIVVELEDLWRRFNAVTEADT